MTTAPAGLLEARRLLLDHLDMHPGQTVAADLDPAEVGIVGDTAHNGGYHCGRDRVVRDDAGNIVDYSVVESPRDRAGLDLDASALDVGYFKVTTSRGVFDLYDFNAWLVGLCKAHDPGCGDIREVIYSPDGEVVKRWDRLGRRTTGSGSHRAHTHISEFRDANGRNMKDLMRRFLIHIGLIGDDDMAKRTGPIFLRVAEGGVTSIWCCDGPWRFKVHPDRVADTLAVWGWTNTDVINAAPVTLVQGFGRDVATVAAPGSGGALPAGEVTVSDASADDIATKAAAKVAVVPRSGTWSSA